MRRWAMGMGGASLFLILLVLVAGGAALYSLYGEPRLDAGPLSVEALHLSPDVSVLGGADLGKVVSTPLFKLARSQGAVAAGLQEVEAKLGLDVEKDLQGVAFGSWSSPGRDREGVVLLRGTFALDRIRKTLEKGGLRSRESGGVAHYDLSPNTSVALVSERLLALGTNARLETFVLNRRSGRRPLNENAVVMAQLRSIPRETALFVLVGEPAVATLEEAAAAGAAMGFRPPPLKALTLTANGSPGLALRVTASPRRGQDVEPFGQQLETLVTLGTAFSAGSPDLKRVFEGLKVGRGASEVTLTLTAPWDVFERAVVGPLLGGGVLSGATSPSGGGRSQPESP